MELPEALQESLKRILDVINPKELKKASFSLSESYLERKKVKDADLPAYLAARLPATFAAQKKVLGILNRHLPEESFYHLLDFGAGPGVGMWAAKEIFSSLKKATLIEINEGMIKLGKQLGYPSDLEVVWESESSENTDLALFSYSFGELEKTEQEKKLAWGFEKTTKALVVIEPGTPLGYENILHARDLLIKWGGRILAPCPHQNICSLKMPSYSQKNDWCHFGVSLSRSFIHRYVKEGSLAFEEEKFSYLIASKIEGKKTDARILRDPQKRSSHVNFFLCTPKGIELKTISKKHPDYKTLKKTKWGDEIKEI